MKKSFVKRLVSVAASLALAAASALNVYAKELIDVEFDATGFAAVSPWENAGFDTNRLDMTKLTDSTEVILEYTYEYTENEERDVEGVDPTTECPVELVVQTWEHYDLPSADPNGGIWARVQPYEWDATTAKFSLADMKAAYGVDDLSTVLKLNMSATSHATVTFKKMTITNCDPKINKKMTDAEKAEFYYKLFIGVLSAALLIIIAIIVAFTLALKRQSSFAYDPTTGSYVKMEKKK